MAFSDALVVAIRERIDYEALFNEFTTLKGQGPERRAFCVFHENTDTPAMSVNVEDGLFCCHNPSCGEKGDVFRFYMRVRSLSFTEAVGELARRVGLDPEQYHKASETPGRGLRLHVPTADDEERVLAAYRNGGGIPQAPSPNGHATLTVVDRVIDEEVVSAMHHRLVNSPSLMEFLAQKRGLTAETVIEYELGHDGQRYYIPIRNDDGACVNIRRYKPDARNAADKMISWRVGFGTARLFPAQAFSGADPIFLMEGEMDCLLARQSGLNAMTTTGGAGTWKEQWNERFAGRHVVICYDADEAGRIGAAHVAANVNGSAASVKVVTIPLAEPPGADFTDYIVGHGHTVDDFLRLVTAAPVYRNEGGSAPETILDREPIALHLSQASKAEYTNVPVRIAVMVSGKTTAPFIVPREVRMGCPTAVRGTLKMCDRCPVAAAAGPVTKRMEFESNDLLQFTNVDDARLQRALKAKVGVPVKCGYARSDVVENMNVEEVQLIPEIQRSEEEAPYVTRAAFYMGHGLQSNRSYLMTGITVPEPKRQLATHLIHTAVPSQSNIDAFRLTEDVVGRLRTFSPTDPGVQGLWSRLGVIYDDLERHTRIYQRRDLMLAVDLVFHSVLRFTFQGELLARGWTEALFIGDSRTGKTTIVQRMVDYYGAGEFGSGENTSLAGLIGGLHQIGNSWALQWGRIPLNDRRLFVIDEAGNLPTEQISRMSSMRSSGIAEVIKVHTERTNARTRQIWISNPRSPRPLSSFSQGVLAVKELIGAPEDIARFDLVVSAASGDVPLAVVNAPRGREAPGIFTSELCHQRVMWVWSRTADQVVWTEGTVDVLLQRATEQGERYRYATEIPLVEPNEQRVKIARLAVATAALFFSASADGSNVLVRPEHVEFAAQFLESLYAKPSMAFDEYAGMQRRRYEIAGTGKVEEIIRRNPGAARALMEQEQFTQRDLQEILAVNDRDQMRADVTALREVGFLRRQGSSFYLKTPAAIRWLRGELSGQSAQQSFMDLMGEGAEVPEEPTW